MTASGSRAANAGSDPSPLRPRPSRTVWFVGAATAFSLLGDQTLYSTVPVRFEELGLRPIEVGLVLSANRWVRMVTNHVAHRLVDRPQQRLLFTGAIVLGAITTLVYATTPAFIALLGARLAWGLCWSIIRHFGLLSVMETTRAGDTGRSAGLLSGISRTGSVAGLLGGAVLVDALGFGPALTILGIVSLLGAPLAWFGFTPFAATSTASTSTTESPADVAPPRALSPAQGATVDRSRLTQLLGLIHGLVGAGLVTGTLGAVLDERISTDGWLSAASLTGGVLALRFVLESLVAPRLGAISDRAGVRRAATGFFALGASALAAASVSPWLPVTLAAVIVFFGCGTALGAALMGFVGHRGSRAVASYVTAADLGAAAGPLIGWIALDLFDERRVGIAIGAGFYVLGAAVAARYLTREHAG